MTNSNFQLAFSLSVSHTYFEGNICKCLYFNPGPVTKMVSKRFEVSQRKEISGFGFYVNPPTSLSAFLSYIADTTGYTYFDFEIATTDPAFSIFTDLSANWLGQLVYDSHNSSNTRQGNVVQLVPSMFTDANTVILGTLTVRFDDIIKQATQGPLQFAINYTARSTQWQYFVINNSAVQMENPSVTGKAGINFNGPETVTIANGQQATLFTSGDNLLPLSSVPKYKFDLVNNPVRQTSQRSSPGKVIYKGLPSPKPKWIGEGGAGNDNGLVSPMYVYI